MTWIVIGAVGMGFILGFYLTNGMIQNLAQISTIALAILLLGIGIDLGNNKTIWAGLRKMGLKIFLIPLAVGVGSITTAGVCALFIGLPINEGTAIGAGFGWYSLSGILLTRLHSAELGALAFLTNVFRELIAILIMPFIARYFGFLTTIAPGGATSMDTTLPLISRLTNSNTALIAFVSGAVLSSLVPILVPLLIQLQL